MLPRQATTLLSAAASSTMLLGWKALLTDVSFCKLEILVFTYGAMARVSLLVGDLSSTRLHETNCSYCNGRNLSHIRNISLALHASMELVGMAVT